MRPAIEGLPEMKAVLFRIQWTTSPPSTSIPRRTATSISREHAAKSAGSGLVLNLRGIPLRHYQRGGPSSAAGPSPRDCNQGSPSCPFSSPIPPLKETRLYAFSSGRSLSHLLPHEPRQPALAQRHAAPPRSHVRFGRGQSPNPIISP